MNIVQARVGIVSVALVLLASCGGDHQTTPFEARLSVTLSPPVVTMDQGATQQFTATVTGSANTAVVWSVREGSAGGSIDANGMYTAPAVAGVFHIVATSAADSSKTAAAQVSVNSVAISVSPTLSDMEPGATQQFTATVTGSVDRNVFWSVIESAGGSITNDGMYTAPAVTGKFHVVAKSAADSTRSATVAIMVANLGVLINPRSVGLSPGNTRSFTASVSGCMDDRVIWAVQEGSAGGVITGNGLYTAPMETGQYHVVATSVAHPSVSGMAMVVVGNSGFSSAGNMTQLRSNHTATLLPNGDVLLVGGEYVGDDGYGHIAATAELFDHITGTFRPTGSMKTARDAHTATLLPDGKVLVAGGGTWFSTNSAELYDPATGQFVPTGNMVASRTDHTATLLSSGKVLIAGGALGWLEDPPNLPPDLAIAELYDPATGTFSPTGRMSQARFQPTATLLADGRVLMAGGATDWAGEYSDSAEVFDPATGTFASVGPFAGKRSSHTATLLANNRVLLAGGERNDWVASEWSYECFDDAQLFDPATSQFSFLAYMNAARSSHTATLLPNGQVLLVGGYGPDRHEDSTAELFDPAKASFLVTGSMARARAGHTATLLLDGRVLVAGGASDKSAELYTQQH